MVNIGRASGKGPACQCRKRKRRGLDRSLGREDSLEKRMATHSSILAWRIPWTEEPGRLQSIELQRVRYNCSDSAHIHKTLIKQKGLKRWARRVPTLAWHLQLLPAACYLKEEGLIVTPYNIISTNGKKRKKQTGREKPVLEPLSDFRWLLNWGPALQDGLGLDCLLGTYEKPPFPGNYCLY